MKKQRPALFEYADPEFGPIMGHKPTRSEDVARLEKKANDIRECIEAIRMMMDRQQGRLDVLEEEIAEAKRLDVCQTEPAF
jgi:hypothetical protein